MIAGAVVYEEYPSLSAEFLPPSPEMNDFIQKHLLLIPYNDNMKSSLQIQLTTTA